MQTSPRDTKPPVVTLPVETPPAETLRVEELLFEVRRSGRRKALQITVDRGGELIVSGPTNASVTQMTAFIREKRFWIYTKLAEKEARKQPIGRKEYISGETFSYLGRRYRLLLVNQQETPLALNGGRFCLKRAEARAGREHFIRWYTTHGQSWIERRCAAWQTRMKLNPKTVALRELGYRWGSCSKGGSVQFHWATLLLPPSIIDYVIVHEFAHLVHRNHTPEFWKLVARTLPDFAERKTWLAERGGLLLGL